MSFHATKLKQRFLILFLLVSASVRVFSQAADSPVVFTSPGGITASFVDCPSLGGTSTTSGSSSKWLKIEFKYSATPVKGDYIDSVQFKVWLEGRDLTAADAPGNEGSAIALTGSATYVCVPKGKDTYGVFYVNPSVLGRYSGKQGPSDFERKFNVHLDALVDGKIVDNIDKTKEEELTWYQKLTAVAGFVCRQDQCPFMLTDPNKYPPLKLSTSAE